MPFDPYLARKLHLMEGLDFHRMTPEMTERMSEFYRDDAEWTVPTGVRIEEIVVAGPHGSIPCRSYQPSAASGRTLVWAHGGGFATGDLDGPESHVVAAELAARSGATVIAVDYRLARDGLHYPVPLDDVHAVLLAALHDEMGTGSAQVAVGGASAGAALALGAALRVAPGTDRDRLSEVLLAYPMVHFPTPALTIEQSAQLAILPAALRTTQQSVEWMFTNYLGRISGLPAEAAPGAAPLDGLPRVSLVVSEYDDLRASAELLARQLEDAAVPVRSLLATGMPHGHLNRVPALPQVDRSLDFLAEALRA